MSTAPHGLFLLRAFLTGFGLLLPVLVLEIAIRTLGPILPGDYQTATFTSAGTVGPQNRPYAAGYKRTSEFKTNVRVNSKRLRGPEIDYAKPAGVHRTLVLGDSFMFALQVDEAETFSARLRDDLAATSGSEQGFEVINGGADGWSTVNEYAWLTTEGYRYEPDLVVLAYYIGNDPGENADQVAGIAPGGRVILRETGTDPVRNARAFLSERSVAWSLLEFGVLSRFTDSSNATEDRRASAATRDPSSDRKTRGWELSQELLKLTRDYCRDRGIPFLLVGIPMAAQLDTSETPMTPLLDIGSRIDVPTVDLFPPFKEDVHDPDDPLYFPKDQHWTAEGHDLAARVVADELHQRGFVPND